MSRDFTRRTALVAGLSAGAVAAATPASAVAIAGAGATFPAPLYARWAAAYRSQTAGAVAYQPIGSSGGIAQIEAKAVDFGASDKPLEPQALRAAGLYQFPAIIGGVVPVMNVPGLVGGQLHLPGRLLAGVFAGQITRWNDAQLREVNPGLPLPNLPITLAHRSDGSGTTFLFTSFLSMMNPDFARSVGANDKVRWPGGVGAAGNGGVAAAVQKTIGAIGYVEFAYAKENRMAYALVQNRAGAYPQPVAASFAAAAARADWTHAPGNYLLLLDQPGGGSWPITGASFILVDTAQRNPAKGRAVLAFFDWAYRNGDALAQSLDYVALPAVVKQLVRRQWADQVRGPDGRSVYVPG